MPRNAQVVRRYSSALIATLSAADLQRAREELRVFHQVLVGSPDIQLFLSNPVISIGDKVGVLESLSKFFPTSLSFLISVVRQGREDFLKEMAEEFERLVEERSGELSVDLEIASASLKASEEEIRLFLQEKWNRSIKLKTTVRPELLGGFVARGGGKVLDASVRNQMNLLRTQVLA